MAKDRTEFLQVTDQQLANNTVYRCAYVKKEKKKSKDELMLVINTIDSPLNMKGLFSLQPPATRHSTVLPRLFSSFSTGN